MSEQLRTLIEDLGIKIEYNDYTAHLIITDTHNPRHKVTIGRIGDGNKGFKVIPDNDSCYLKPYVENGYNAGFRTEIINF